MQGFICQFDFPEYSVLPYSLQKKKQFYMRVRLVQLSELRPKNCSMQTIQRFTFTLPQLTFLSFIVFIVVKGEHKSKQEKKDFFLSKN